MQILHSGKQKGFQAHSLMVRHICHSSDKYARFPVKGSNLFGFSRSISDEDRPIRTFTVKSHVTSRLGGGTMMHRKFGNQMLLLAALLSCTLMAACGEKKEMGPKELQ